MRQAFDVEYVVGDRGVEDGIADLRAFPIFSEGVLSFLAGLSERLRGDSQARNYADLMSLAFFCRRASLDQMRRPYRDDAIRLGRGTVFHIAPSNVALNFAYSLIAAFLAGNASIVRLPSKDFPQVEIFCRILSGILKEWKDFRPYFLLVRYGHQQETNDHYSALCQTRVIWGGDRTIADLRRSPLPPRANEITFADRHSIALIQSEVYLATQDKQRIAQDFYNDSYLHDQNACTSPRIVVWIGEGVQQAQEIFWQELHALLQGSYDLLPVQAVDKWVRAFRLGASCRAHLVPMQDNLITRVCVEDLQAELMEEKTGSGFFLEYVAEDFAEILPLCGRGCQTLSYYGMDAQEIARRIAEMRAAGVDRIARMGRTMDFALVWDGVDLIRTMSREISW